MPNVQFSSNGALPDIVRNIVKTEHLANSEIHELHNLFHALREVRSSPASLSPSIHRASNRSSLKNVLVNYLYCVNAVMPSNGAPDCHLTMASPGVSMPGNTDSLPYRAYREAGNILGQAYSLLDNIQDPLVFPAASGAAVRTQSPHIAQDRLKR